jgi:hypothetical protein
MSPLDALLHLGNFLAPALGVALIAGLAAKLLWRRELMAVPLLRLWLWGSAAGAASLIAGLVILGRDGKMLTYAGLVATTALALWWAGFARR